jgi:hypothetical protein
MTSPQRVGRTMGAALLLQVLLAPPLYFRVLPPVTGREFLANAAAHAAEIRIALVLLFVLSLATLIAALAALPIVRRYSERMAFAYVGLGVLGLATLAAETVASRHMLALSLEYAKPGAAQDVLRTLGGLARASWVDAHFTNLVVGHATAFLLYTILVRFRLVPRVLAAAGMAASLLSTTVVASTLVGMPLPFGLVMPMGVVQLLLIVWLLVKGLDDRAHERQAEAGAGRFAIA